MRKVLRIIREPRARLPPHRECVAILLSERLRHESARRRKVPWFRPNVPCLRVARRDQPLRDPEVPAQWLRSLSRCAVFCQHDKKEVSMLTLKHISAAVLAAALASAIVVDTADARRGGGGGGGMRAGGFGGGGMRAGGFGGGSLRTASFNRGGFAGNRFANASFGRRADIGRPGWGWAGGGWGGRWAGGRWGGRWAGGRWGWGGGWGGNNWGWGAAALGVGLAYASSTYCDPYYDYYGNCGYGYGSYGSYAPAFGFGTYRPFVRAYRARWW